MRGWGAQGGKGAVCEMGGERWNPRRWVHVRQDSEEVRACAPQSTLGGGHSQHEVPEIRGSLWPLSGPWILSAMCPVNSTLCRPTSCPSPV